MSQLMDGKMICLERSSRVTVSPRSSYVRLFSSVVALSLVCTSSCKFDELTATSADSLAATGSTTSSTTSTAALAADLADAMASPDAPAAWQELSRMTFAEYYQAVLQDTQNGVTEIDGVDIDPTAQTASSAQVPYASLYSSYKTIGDLWKDPQIAFDPAQMTLDGFSAAVKMATDYVQGNGGFAVGPYQDGTATDPASAGTSLNLVFVNPFTAYDCYRSYQQAADSFNTVYGAYCTLGCTKFWTSVTACKEVIRGAVWVMKKTKPDAKSTRYFSKLAKFAIAVAPAMRRFTALVAKLKNWIFPAPRAVPDQTLGDSRTVAAASTTPIPAAWTSGDIVRPSDVSQGPPNAPLPYVPPWTGGDIVRPSDVSSMPPVALPSSDSDSTSNPPPANQWQGGDIVRPDNVRAGRP